MTSKILILINHRFSNTYYPLIIVGRLYLSAEPAGDPAYHIIPQGILESAIKITNEPPIGMWANLHKVTLRISTRITLVK